VFYARSNPTEWGGNPAVNPIVTWLAKCRLKAVCLLGILLWGVSCFVNQNMSKITAVYRYEVHYRSICQEGEMTLSSDQELTDEQIVDEVGKYLQPGDRVIALKIKDL